EFGQQHGVQLEPGAGLVPKLEVVATRLATAAAQLGGEVVPGDTGLEDEQDAREDLAVAQGLAAGEAEAARRRGRQQRLEALPQRIGNKRFHGLSSFRSGDSPPEQERAARVPLAHFFRTL